MIRLLLILAAIVACTAPAPHSSENVIPAASPSPDGAVPRTASGNPSPTNGAPGSAGLASLGVGGLRGSPAPAGQPTPAAPAKVSPAPLAARGVASWYRDYSRPILGLYAAVPSWRWGDRRYQLLVRSGGRSVVVWVLDACGCPGRRVVDLSPAAFRRLAPLSRGVVAVTLELVATDAR